MTATILAIEDQADLRTLLRVVLERAGHRLIEAVDGRSGLRTFHQHHPDLVLLDVGLPDLDGWQVLERLRELSDVPVLMVTARSLEGDKVRGLDAGADDYMTKPFGSAELVARVNAGLRRGRADRPDVVEVFTDGHLEVHFAEHRVRVGGRDVTLTPLEHRLLVTLLRHPDQVLSPEQLLAHAWHDPSRVAPERVKFVVARLRRKLGDRDPATSSIAAVRGFGYQYRSATR